MAGEMSPISSRNIVPPSRQRETAGLVLPRVGERAGLVAEQLGFQQRVRQRAAVDGHEPLGLAGARARAWRGRTVPCPCRWRLRSAPCCRSRPPRGSSSNNCRMAALRPMMFGKRILLPAPAGCNSSTSRRSRKLSTPPMTRPRSSLSTAVEMLMGMRWPRGVDDVNHLVDHRPAGGQGLLQGAGAFADAGAEHFGAAAPEASARCR